MAQVVEGDLREVVTEDGIQYFPDLEVIEIVGDTTYIAPVSFPASRTARWEAEEYAEQAKVDSTWKKYEPPVFSYSDGTEDYFDSEEEYFMNGGF